MGFFCPLKIRSDLKPMNILHAMQRTTIYLDMTVVLRTAYMLTISLLTACATRLDPSPVVDRSSVLNMSAVTIQSTVLPDPLPLNYYRVKLGDTLYRIALKNGQNYRDIAVWNNLSNPHQITVNQLLRIAPPDATNIAASTTPPSVSISPVMKSSVQNTLSFYDPASIGTTVPPKFATHDTNATMMNNVTFAWPVHGPILNAFDGSKNKGINIGGVSGNTVQAAGNGRVVYVGNGLRGYGHLIIIKHNATYLTAYAHNSALMVKEGDIVIKGQKIAEMGNTDSNRVMLHFEVRRDGKPVDPLKYLPPR